MYYFHQFVETLKFQARTTKQKVLIPKGIKEKFVSSAYRLTKQIYSY